MRTPVEHEHRNSRGERVRILGWPVEGARTALLVHHGLGEHIGRYQTFADALPDVAIWGYDARGHGLHTEKRGHANGLDELAADLQAMVPELLARSGAERVVLFGHSMGAAVTLTYLLDRQPHPAVAAVVLSAPPVAVELDGAQKVKVLVGRLLAKFAPAATLASGLSHEGISSLPDEVRRYAEDPLVHDRISLELARSLIDDAPTMVPRASAVTLPTLLLHGADDPIALPRGSAQLEAVIPGSRRVLIPGARHEVHHDHPSARDTFFGAVRTFVESQAQG